MATALTTTATAVGYADFLYIVRGVCTTLHNANDRCGNDNSPTYISQKSRALILSQQSNQPTSIYLRSIALNRLWCPPSYKLHTHRCSDQTLRRSTADASTKNILKLQERMYPDTARVPKVNIAPITDATVQWIQRVGFGAATENTRKIRIS